MGEFLQVYAGFHHFDGFECFEQGLKKVPIQVGVRMSSCHFLSVFECFHAFFECFHAFFITCGVSLLPVFTGHCYRVVKTRQNPSKPVKTRQGPVRDYLIRCACYIKCVRTCSFIIFSGFWGVFIRKVL